MTQGVTHNWNHIRVVRQYFYQDGTPIAGYVVFAAATGVLTDGTVVVAREVAVKIINGELNTTLLAIEDLARGTTGWVYTVTEKFVGARSPYRIMVSAADELIDLATAAPVVTPPELVSSRGPMGDVTPAATAALTGAQVAQAAAEAAALRAEAAVGGGDGLFTQAQADGRYLQTSAVGAANGVAGLDTNRQVDLAALPNPLVSFDQLIDNILA